MYRLPHESEYFVMRQTKGELVKLYSYAEIGNEVGFVFAPFSVSKEMPIFVIKPDVYERKTIIDIDENSPITNNRFCSQVIDRQTYNEKFKLFHSELNKGNFDKIVLSRCLNVCSETSYRPEELFIQACKLYPRMFISLVSIPEIGTWLMATPEILLEGNGKSWRTIALAGTMELTKSQLSFDTPASTITEKDITWSDKNIREQRCVASFIKSCLSAFTSDISENGPYTVRAGGLIHLRSDFTFTLPSDATIGEFISKLHPTPAVCGLPRDETYDFIQRHEGFDRKYYSGFAGVIDKDGDTHLYVTLRCMNISSNQFNFFAGGGLLKDSTEEAEWSETELKMETMKKCFATKKM